MSVYDLNRIEVPLAPPEFEDHTANPHFVPAPCQVACPIGTDAPSYIGYIWEGRYDAAFEAITATNPFSSICGRVCDAPCEPACRRTDSDGPLQIRNLKRFVMDKLGASWAPQPAAVTETKTVAIVGAGPAGLTAAHDLCVAGYQVDVYEMSDRAGGMMIWGIPAFRLPPGIIEEDIQRLHKRCPGLSIHLNCELGRDVTLDELKGRHDAVLLTIGSWWGKAMDIPGEVDDRVIDGVSFLRQVNDGERPQMPPTVVVVGGGDVAMDACRAALRLPGAERVKVIYRRGPDEIPARRIELEGAIAEGVEFIYNTQQVSIEHSDDQLAINCITTASGVPDDDGRCRPEPVAGSEHVIDCGLVIAAVGQHGACTDLDEHGLMNGDRVRTDWDTMRTDDAKVFAAGDGAFGGSTIVMAMHHGQRAAYYVRHFLQGTERPLPYRTPYRTRQVVVAQDIRWEKFSPRHPEFYGLGEKPIEFPEIESTYDEETAKAEASRCYRCDAETGSADYSVRHREDIFSMARTHPSDYSKLRAMLKRRLQVRDNPFPEQRAATLDDVVVLPANLSRLVIDPYREACAVALTFAGTLQLAHPFLVAGFDLAPAQISSAVVQGLAAGQSPYLGRRALPGTVWVQIINAGDAVDKAASAVAQVFQAGVDMLPTSAGIPRGFIASHSTDIAAVIEQTLSAGLEFMIIDGSGGLGGDDVIAAELRGAPDLSLLREAIAFLRDAGREEAFDIVYFGGVRSGTDAAKLIGLGANMLVLGVAAGIAAGGRIDDDVMTFSAELNDEERATALTNIINASIGEASMMARCSGKTRLENIEPEDLRAVTIATAVATGLPMVGHEP